MSASTMNLPLSFLIDTNLLIAFMRGEQSVRDRIDQAGVVWISATSVGELYYGASYSGSPTRNTARVAQLVGNGRVLACDADTAAIYGDLKGALRRRGRLIPDNDIWIAASAVQRDLALATRDAHFDVVPGLSVHRW